MLDQLRQSVRILTACVLVAVFAFPSNLLAETHLVSPAELQRDLLAASAARQHNRQVVEQFLSTPAAEKVMKSAHMDSEKVKSAVATLDDQELSQLASRAQKAQLDFAAGRLADRDLILIILGIAALILIIVAVR
jgi:hypothetical protein